KTEVAWDSLCSSQAWRRASQAGLSESEGDWSSKEDLSEGDSLEEHSLEEQGLGSESDNSDSSPLWRARSSAARSAAGNASADSKVPPTRRAASGLRVEIRVPASITRTPQGKPSRMRRRRSRMRWFSSRLGARSRLVTSSSCRR